MKTLRRSLVLAPSLILMMSMVATTSAYAPASDGVEAAAIGGDNLPSPLAEEQSERHSKAFESVVNGKVKPQGDNQVVKVAKGQYVELAREGEDSIWTVLGEFGDTVNPTYGGALGPDHNQIPEPDRDVDNTTIWAPDFSKAYYEDLLFSEAAGDVSMRNFYIEQSSNRYTVNGDVADWVQVPGNAANYGANYCGSIVCARTWLFVRDSVNAWYNAQVTAGLSDAEIEASLAQFDVWDRYDWDGDGNFDEPDGYIDHFQSVHAGEGEETGGGAQGTDAIWSHRWYAFYNNIGFTGPSPDYLLGGIKIGNTNKWIGDYTIEPENGGVGVFAHEFGHDLGLPDLYDVSGNTGGAENSTGFWTLYSSGSYGSTGDPAEGIGSKPVPMSAYEKIFLGWSTYKVVGYGQGAGVRLGPASATTKHYQQLVVLLPNKNVEFDLGDPFEGSYFWHSGAGDNVDSRMTRSYALPAADAAFSAKVNYDTEADFDYFFVRVSNDNGATWTALPTNLDDVAGTPGISGNSSGNWVDLTATIPASFGGGDVLVQIRYLTDGGVVNPGVSVDNVSVGGAPVDGAETEATFALTGGFTRTTGTVVGSFFNAYFAEFRNYRGYDDSLRTGPYNFGFLDDPDLQNWVEHFPYQDGLLVWYYDESFADNGVGDHCAAGRCGGLVLPVDAHPDLLLRPDNGRVWRPRIQSFDSTFGLEPTDAILLHANSVEQDLPSLPAVSTFDDDLDYWVAPNAAIGNNGWSSVPVPHTGTTITVMNVSPSGDFMQVLVNR